MRARQLAAWIVCVASVVAVCALSPKAAAQASGDVPDVSGLWSTAHDFDVSQSMRGEPGRGLSGLKSLPDDLILKLERRPGLRDLRPVLAPMITEATSPWLQTIIRIGDDIGAILGSLRSEGAMSLSKGQDPSLVTGTEQWGKLVFAWLPLCGD